MTNLDSILKSRGFTMPTKVCIVKAMVFPAMDVRVGPQRKLSPERLMLSNCGTGEDSWVPCISKKSNQSILKETNPKNLLEGLMLRLKLQSFGLLMWRANSLGRKTKTKTKTPNLLLGKIEGKRRRGQRMRWLYSIIDSMDMNLSKLQEIVKDRKAWCTPVHGVTKS